MKATSVKLAISSNASHTLKAMNNINNDDKVIDACTNLINILKMNKKKK